MYLLDTCTLLWLVLDQAHLSDNVRLLLPLHRHRLFVSSVSGFEIFQKYAKGKLSLEIPVDAWMTFALRLHGLKIVSLGMDAALRAGSLPVLHADPFDRLLIATAQGLGLTLLTPDPLIRRYPGLMTYW